MTSLAASPASAPFVYFGTYTRTPPSKGIYVARFDSNKGTITAPALAAEAVNPTFIARHPTLPVIYAVSNSTAGTKPVTGVVTAYAINPKTGVLTVINQVADGDTNGTYIAITPDGRTALTAHYTGGYINSFAIHSDGSLGECASHAVHTMTGTHPQQNAPHPHCVDVSPDGRFAFVADLAADRIFSYRIGHDSKLTDGKIAAEVTAQSGVRHVAFSTDARRLYAINELAATISVFDYDAANGTLRPVETVPTVGADFAKRRWASEIITHPNGKFLYASNRDDDESIAAFAISASSGKLTFLQRTGGLAHPRHFAIDPSGQWLLCANHDANDVVVFRIDATTGKLSEPLARTTVPTCVCIVFAPAK